MKITQIEKDGEKYDAVLKNYNGATSATELQTLLDPGKRTDSGPK